MNPPATPLVGPLPPAVTEQPVTAATLERVIADLRRARLALAGRPRRAVLDAISAAVEDWLRPDSARLAHAVSVLPATTGFSAPMIAYALPAMLEPLRRPHLEQLLADEFTDGTAPELILHVLPGNLPGLAAIPTALSLAIGSATLLKAGRGDRVFPQLFIESLAAHDAELGAAAAVRYWRGGELGCEEVALAAAELVVAAGDDSSIAALATRSRGRFIGHGHRISFAVVDAVARDDPHTADGLAIDVATWDQRGCLSPQLCFVEGDFDSACSFAERLAAALDRQALALPAAQMTIGERLAIRRWRDEADWARFGGEQYRLIAAADEAAGTIVVEPSAVFRPSPLARSVRILPIAGLDELTTVLAPVRGVLEGAGLEVDPAQRQHWERCLSGCGVHLISRLGAMQRPPLNWRQGGHRRLAGWDMRRGDGG